MISSQSPIRVFAACLFCLALSGTDARAAALTIRGVVTNLQEATAITGAAAPRDGNLAGTQVTFTFGSSEITNPISLTLGADTTVQAAISDLTRQIAQNPLLTRTGLAVTLRAGKLSFSSAAGQLEMVEVKYKRGHSGDLGMEGPYVPAIRSGSYLQLVLPAADGGVHMSIAASRFSSPSNLPKTVLPNAGPFSIQCDDLKPGKYLLVAQGALLFPQRLALLEKDGQLLRIEVSEAIGPEIDVGTVTIPLSR